MKIRKLFETTVTGFIASVAIASLAACSSESTSSTAVAASHAEVSVPTAPAVVVAPTSTPEPEPTPDQPAGTPTKGDWVSTIVTDSFSVAKVIGET